MPAKALTRKSFMPPGKNDMTLPVGFDGVFKFTNFTDREFKAKWNNVEYSFPAMSTSPMVILGETPENVQHIRKKFAKELAEREFYSTEKFKYMNAPERGERPAIYTDSDLEPFIQRCLEPLPIANATMQQMPRDSQENYKKDPVTGDNITKPVIAGTSLLQNGSAVVA